MKPIVLVNVPDLSPGEAFVNLAAIDGRPIEWVGRTGLPANAVERLVRRPRISRYRAALSATLAGRKADALITHLPGMTAAVEQFARLLGRSCPHLAFSFNFTQLPAGSKRLWMRDAFRGVEQFCVYSEHEASLYPEVFQLAAERFRHVIWTQDPPPVAKDVKVPDGPFAVAVGGEGRDVRSILEAARATPDIRWVIIARPRPDFDSVPENVTLHFNLPLAMTWGIAARAVVLVVPLVAPDTCCGHITIVSGQQLGLPLVTTRSVATREYVEGFNATTVIGHGDPEALAHAVRAHVEAPEEKRVAAIADQAKALVRYDRAIWADYLADFLRKIES